MFLVTFDIGTKQWLHDEYFETINEAKSFIESEGFVNKNGFYEKDYKGWFPNTRAFIKPLKKSRSRDFYFSNKSFALFAEMDGGYNEVFINGRWIPFTEQIGVGKKPLSQWEDLMYLGQSSDTRYVKIK